MHALPTTIRDEAHLEDLLSKPTDGACAALGTLRGDLLVLGAAGKMGPTLCRMARRALDRIGSPHRVIAVSRFSTPGSEDALRAHGVETLQADLLDPAQLAALPDCPEVLFMAGRKFGAADDTPLTWAMNTHVPALVCQRFPESRRVAFSTGNVYPLTPLARGGSVESDPPEPIGEYAMSCLGRERLFEHFARQHDAPTALLRLNYAAELRYGVPVDIARRVQAGAPIPLAMGTVNVLWQGDANALALQCFALADVPATVWNLAGPEQLSVRRMATVLGERLGKTPVFEGEEAATALLSNGQALHARAGYPRVPAGALLEWIADWVARDGASLGKPTRFEARDGRF